MTSAHADHSGTIESSRRMIRQRTFHKDPGDINPSLNLPVIATQGERCVDWNEPTHGKDTPGGQKSDEVKPENSFYGQLCEHKTVMTTTPQLLSANVSRNGPLEKQLKATTEALEVLKQGKTTLESNITRLCEDKSRLEEENKRLDDNIKRLTEENRVLEDKLQVTQMDLETCTERINEKDRTERELKADALRMQSETRAMGSNLSALHTEIDALNSRVKKTEKQHSDQVSFLEGENARLSSRVRELEQEASDLRESVRRSEIEKEKLMVSSDTCRVHQDRLQKAKIENEKVQKELESVREEYRREKLRVTEYKHKVSQINAAKDKLNSDKVAQEKELRQLRSDIIKGQEFSTTLLERITDYNNQIDKLLQHNQAILLVLDKERSETNELQKRLQQCENDQEMTKRQLQARSQGGMSVENNVNYKNILEENKKLRLLLMEKEFESTHLLSDREELKEKLVELKKRAIYEENMVEFKELAKDTKVHPNVVESGPIKGSTWTPTGNGQIPSETEKLSPSKRSFPAIKTETKTNEMHFSCTVNYSTRRKYLQQLRRERRW
ncbi:M protein, serotype 6-like [Liolophura sinensis]|uniref:M protein, serotype 6-like n=1 Tax=Liolophura sinensis TaxID=3198878 RepID=UPI0031586D52